MTEQLDADKFLEDLSGRYARPYIEAFEDMLIAEAMGDRVGLRAAKNRSEEVIRDTMGTAEVLGASLTLRRAAAVLAEDGGVRFAAERPDLLSFAETPTQKLLPRVTFEESVQDMIDRTPVTIRRAAERTGQRISQLYSEGRVVAFAHSAEASVTKRVQELLVEALREGIPEYDAGRRIITDVDVIRKRTRAWTQSYARTVFRTNVNTAVTAGRFRQAQDPDIKAVVPAFQFDAVGDADTRDNHDAADGVVLRVDNPQWNRIAPPLGYNCRCQVRMVGLPELRRMGRVEADGSIREDRVPAAAHADPGFRHGGRPDLFIVGGLR